YGFLMLLVPDLGKAAGDLELHTLLGRDLPRSFFPDTFVKIGDRCAQRAGDLKQSSGRNAIDATLIFMSLLIGHSDHFGESLLGQPQHNAAFADPPPTRCEIPPSPRRSPHPPPNVRPQPSKVKPGSRCAAFDRCRATSPA